MTPKLPFEPPVGDPDIQPLSPAAQAALDRCSIIKASRVIGKWCHIGRVNTPGRYEYFRELGADSCDGTGLARYSHMRHKIYSELTDPRLPLA